MASDRVWRCAACKGPLDDEAVAPADRGLCPSCGSRERELALMPSAAEAHASALAPRIEVDYVLDAVTLAHAGIILSLVSTVGFGVSAEAGSGWFGVVAGVLVALAWLVVCKVRAVRNRVVVLVRGLAEP
jgi:hypothetical protein